MIRPGLFVRYLDAVTASLISGGLTAGTGIGADILNYFNNKNINAQNIAFAREMNDLEYERYMQQWNRENAYNTPTAQIQRLVDAGLNPNLVYDSLANSNLGASSVPSAAVPGSKPTQFDFDQSVAAGTNQYLQGRLLEAQVKELDSKSKMNYVTAHRISLLTQPEYDSMVANTARIRQIIDSEEYRTKVEQIKADMLNRNTSVDFTDGDKISSWYDSFRSLVEDNELSRLICSKHEFNLGIEYLYEQIGLLSNQSHHVELENQDLQEFLNVCARIYEGQAADADVVVQSAELTKSFQESLGNAPKYIQLIVQMLNSLVNGVSRFTPAPRSSHN